MAALDQTGGTESTAIANTGTGAGGGWGGGYIGGVFKLKQSVGDLEKWSVRERETLKASYRRLLERKSCKIC